MTENRSFSLKISILGSFNPFGAVKDINIFEKTFQLFESPYKKAAIICPAISVVHFLGIHSTLVTSFPWAQVQWPVWAPVFAVKAFSHFFLQHIQNLLSWPSCMDSR